MTPEISQKNFENGDQANQTPYVVTKTREDVGTLLDIIENGPEAQLKNKIKELELKKIKLEQDEVTLYSKKLRLDQRVNELNDDEDTGVEMQAEYEQLQLESEKIDEKLEKLDKEYTRLAGIEEK